MIIFFFVNKVQSVIRISLIGQSDWFVYYFFVIHKISSYSYISHFSHLYLFQYMAVQINILYISTSLQKV